MHSNNQRHLFSDFGLGLLYSGFSGRQRESVSEKTVQSAGERSTELNEAESYGRCSNFAKVKGMKRPISPAVIPIRLIPSAAISPARP